MGIINEFLLFFGSMLILRFIAIFYKLFIRYKSIDTFIGIIIFPCFILFTILAGNIRKLLIIILLFSYIGAFDLIELVEYISNLNNKDKILFYMTIIPLLSVALLIGTHVGTANMIKSHLRFSTYSGFIWTIMAIYFTISYFIN